MRKPRIDGVKRRIKIVSYLRENPGKRHFEIARGVGLATHHSYSPTLEGHLTVLEREGYVRRVGLAYEAAV